VASQSRQRRNIDMGRLREALRGPDVDTRVWLATATVDNDPDAIRWEAESGWIVDVTFYGGPLDGDGPVACRLAATYAAAGATRSDPPSGGDEVIVSITDGDPNSNPIIVARLHNQSVPPPALIFGLPITEVTALLAHILVSPLGLQEEYALPARLKALSWLLEGVSLALAGTVALGVTTLPDGSVVPPTQPMLRGADFTGATLGQLLTALNTFALALGPAIALLAPAAVPAPAVTALGTAATALGNALTSFQAAAVANLSTRVVGE